MLPDCSFPYSISHIYSTEHLTIRAGLWVYMHWLVSSDGERSVCAASLSLTVRVHQKGQPNCNPCPCVLIEKHSTYKRQMISRAQSFSRRLQNNDPQHKVSHCSQYGACSFPGMGRYPITQAGTEWVRRQCTFEWTTTWQCHTTLHSPLLIVFSGQL